MMADKADVVFLAAKARMRLAHERGLALTKGATTASRKH